MYAAKRAKSGYSIYAADQEEDAAPRGPLIAADTTDRTQSVRPPSGYAVRLAIPSIKVDTVVKQGGIVKDPR